MNYVAKVKNRLTELLTDCDSDLLDLYTLLAFVSCQSTDLEDVHNAWAVWRNNTKPDHQSLIPFEYLTSEIQALDQSYRDAICRVASEFSL